MPTEAEYEEYAGGFDEFKGQANEIANNVLSPPYEYFRGKAADELRKRLSEIYVRIEEFADGLSDLSTECERRAEVCGDFAAEMKRYEGKLAAWYRKFDDFDPAQPWATTPGPRPVEPEPSASWVEI